MGSDDAAWRGAKTRGRLYDAVAIAQSEWESSRLEYPETELVDPTVIEFERQFVLSRGGLQESILNISDEGEGDELGSIASPAQSVVSMDSIAQNADFVDLINILIQLRIFTSP